MNQIKTSAMGNRRVPVGTFRNVFHVLILLLLLIASGCANRGKGPVTGAGSTVPEDLKQSPDAILESGEKHVEQVPQATGAERESRQSPVGRPAGDQASGNDRAHGQFIDTPFGWVRVKPDGQASTAAGSAPAAGEPARIKPAGQGKDRTPEIQPVIRPEGESAPSKAPLAVEQARKPGTPGQETPADAGVSSSEAAGLVLNFEEADLGEVVRMFAQLLNISYTTDGSLKGKVTIHTAGSLKRDDLFPVFFHILELNGLSAILNDGLYRIVKSKDAPQFTDRFRVGSEADDRMDPGERVIVQIVPLQYIAVQEMVKLLTPFMSGGGTIVSHDESNIVILVDKGAIISKALKMIQVFDVDMFQRVHHRILTLRHVDAEETAKLMNDLLKTYTGARKTETSIISLTRLNALLIVSRDTRVIEKMEEFLPLLDVASESTEPKIYVYPVKNGQAEELGTLLNQVLGSAGATTTSDKGKTNKPKSQATSETPAAEEKPPMMPFETAAQKAKREAAGPGGASVDSFGSGTLRSEVKITPDTIRNALIIQALPSDYKILTDILKSIDVLPRQVLIEVTIAEISLDDSTSMGVEWSFLKDKGGIKGFLNASIGEKGVSYTLGLSEEWTNALSALAKREKVNILSSPSLLASDNKEASINVSTQVPVASAEYQYNTGQEGMLQTNIQYRDTGIILSVTPHINDRGLVSMDIRQEVSEQSQGVDVGGQNYPSFRERSVTTTLTVNHGQTIVIGGLMQETRGKTRMGVPFLSRIPLIGWIFGKQGHSISKSELIIMITPHVIASLDDVDLVTQEFKNKVTGLAKRID